MEDYSLETIMKEIKNLNTRLNMLQVTVNDINTKSSENTVMANALHEFMSRFSASEIELMKPQKPKKTSKKSKKDSNIDTIKSLEKQTNERPTSNYNVFVDLVKGDTDFANKIAIVWSSEDPSIDNDPHKINYATFYETYISSKVPEDKVPKSIRKIRKLIAEAREEMKNKKSD